MPNYWVIAPFYFENPKIWQCVWERNLKDGFISVGWESLKNVSALNEHQIFQRHRQKIHDKTEKGAHADSKVLHKFWHNIRIGDVVVARRGRKCIAAIGIVTSMPYYDPKKAKKSFEPEPAYPNHLDIKWNDVPRDVQFQNQVFGMQAIHSISKESLQGLLNRSSGPNGSIYPDEITNDVDYITEGGRKTVIVNAYERSGRARSVCLRKYGYHCAVCGMLFANVYGEIGINFIHVHHNNPIAARKKAYRIDPSRDLTPVCPNCHAMLHSCSPPLTINKLRSIVEKQRRQNM